MKKLLLVLVFCAGAVSILIAQQAVTIYYAMNTKKGSNSFNTQFNVNATDRNDLNSYLLSYITTAVYPEKLLEFESPAVPPSTLTIQANILQRDTALFMKKFREITSPYFGATSQYRGADMEYFNNTTDLSGYDPEAVLIPTSNAIFVVFRGIDKVALPNNTNTDLNFEVQEWVQTSAQAISYTPPVFRNKTFQGAVHRGMWLSLSKIAERLANRIQQLVAGTNKKVWIAGNSLGGGLAQLFGYYLAKYYNIIPQAVYGFASPQVGNSAFNEDFMTLLGNNKKLQRFDFMDDPITAVAAVAGFLPAGTRSLYTNIDNMSYNVANRSAVELTRIISSMPAIVSTAAGFGFGGICYHQQNWYVQAAHRQLTAAEKNNVPDPLPLPTTATLGCESGVDICLATNTSNSNACIVNAVKNGAYNIANKIINTIGEVAEAITGNTIKTGTGIYKITCLQDGKTLMAGWCNNNNGCPLYLWQEDGGVNNRFEIFRKGAAYGIKVTGTNRVIDVPQGSTAAGARIQIWDDVFTSLPFQHNQIWYFHNIVGNKYVIENEKSKKVLDASGSRTNVNGCEIYQWDYNEKKANQIWVLEKIN